MFEVGHTFEKNGISYCVLDIYKNKGKEYLLLSSKDEKLSFEFYEVIEENDDTYTLVRLDDKNLINKLLSRFEKRNAGVYNA